MRVRPETLSGQFVRLEPLAEEHRAGLARAADDPEIWVYLPHNGTGAAFDGWFDASLKGQADPRQLVFAVRRLADDRLLGSTRYMRIEAEHVDPLEIVRSIRRDLEETYDYMESLRTDATIVKQTAQRAGPGKDGQGKGRDD